MIHSSGESKRRSRQNKNVPQGNFFTACGAENYKCPNNLWGIKRATSIQDAIQENVCKSNQKVYKV